MPDTHVESGKYLQKILAMKIVSNHHMEDQQINERILQWSFENML
jgi:hypothetical protein